MTRFLLELIFITLLTAESITNGLKSRLCKIWRRKMEFRKKSNIVECIHSLLLSRFHMTFALFGLFCWFFAGFLASFQHWFKSLLFIFITGTRFENHSSIALLKLSPNFFFVVLYSCKLYDAATIWCRIWVWWIMEWIIRNL